MERRSSREVGMLDGYAFETVSKSSNVTWSLTTKKDYLGPMEALFDGLSGVRPEWKLEVEASLPLVYVR